MVMSETLNGLEGRACGGYGGCIILHVLNDPHLYIPRRRGKRDISVSLPILIVLLYSRNTGSDWYI